MLQSSGGAAADGFSLVPTLVPMRYTFLLPLALACGAHAQSPGGHAVFERLLLQNDAGETLVVQVGDPAVWVTPGYYRGATRTVREGLDSVARSYGLAASAPELHGSFTLLRDGPHGIAPSLRNVYLADVTAGTAHAPTGVTAVAWWPTDRLLSDLSFPHIAEMARLVIGSPDTLWGGTLRQTRSSLGEPGYEVVEPPYCLGVLRARVRASGGVFMDQVDRADRADLGDQRAAVLAALNGETAAAFSRDYDAWAAHWIHRDDVTKTYIDFRDDTHSESVGFSAIDSFVRDFFAAHPEPEPVPELLDEIDVRFYGSAAYVTYEQLDGLRGRKRETRLMEREDGRWKIAGMHTTIYGAE